MDYSESLIAIQTAKDKASQACRERDWEKAQECANEMVNALLEFRAAVLDQQVKARFSRDPL